MTEPQTITFKLHDLHALARVRPAGYVADVLGRAVQVTDTHYTLRRVDYAALRAKYRGQRPVAAGDGLGDRAEKLIKRFGLDRLYKRIKGIAPDEDCSGCVKRREVLNWLGRKFRGKEPHHPGPRRVDGVDAQ